MDKNPNSETGSDDNAKEKTISVWNAIFVLLAFIVIVVVGMEILGIEGCQNLERTITFNGPRWECADGN